MRALLVREGHRCRQADGVNGWQAEGVGVASSSETIHNQRVNETEVGV